MLHLAACKAGACVADARQHNGIDDCTRLYGVLYGYTLMTCASTMHVDVLWSCESTRTLHALASAVCDQYQRARRRVTVTQGHTAFAFR